MKSWNRSVSAAAILVVVAFLVVACVNVATGPTTATGGSASQSQGGGPSASPSPGAAGDITRVAVSSFGESCPAGVSPITDPATVRQGCTEEVTCTPKMRGPSGSEIDAPPSVHGPAPDVFALTSGSGSVATFDQRDVEPFNGGLKGVAPGQATLLCVVKGVRSEPKVFTVQR